MAQKPTDDLADGEISQDLAEGAVEEVRQDPNYKSVLSEEGKHPTVSKALGYIPAVAATGAGLLASETGPGAILAAGAAGAAGKGLENALREKMGFQAPQKSASKELTSMLGEGAKQSAYELGGRVVGAIGGRALAKVRGVKPEVVGETISGVRIPETVGQAYGKPGGLTQTIEHYLGKAWVGGSLKDIQVRQQSAFRDILANLSKTSDATPGALSGNWERAAQETKISGGELYKALGDSEATTVSPIASDILKDETLPIPTKARRALEKLATDPHMEIAQSLGYKTTDQARKGVGERVWEQLVQKEAAAGKSASKGTIQDAIDARSELRDLMVGSRDRNLKRLYGDAWKRLDEAIDSSLTPEQRAIKTEADKLWRRSYIQERITKNLQRMQNVQAPNAAPSVSADAFVKMTNELAHAPLTHVSGEVVKKTSDLDVLFDNPSDRKAMVDLANLMQTKYKTLGGQAGISESIARIGVALEALRVPVSLAMGHPVGAATAAVNLGALMAMSKVLASPGGSKMLLQYFNSTGAAAVAGAARIAGEAMEQKAEDKAKAKKSPNVAQALTPPVSAIPNQNKDGL